MLLIPWLLGTVSVCAALTVAPPAPSQNASISVVQDRTSCPCKKALPVRNKSPEKGPSTPPSPKQEKRSGNCPYQSHYVPASVCCRVTCSSSSARAKGTCVDPSKAEREDRVVLRQAQAASEDKDWANAQKLYAEAMKSCVPWISQQASIGYESARQWSTAKGTCADPSKAEREDRVVLRQAQAASEDKDWENAQKLYAEARKSCVAWITQQAGVGYEGLRGWSSGLRWNFPGFTPIYRRFVLYPWPCWILLFLLLCAVAGPALWNWEYDGRFHGEARLLLPLKLTDDGLPELFAAEVYQASQEVEYCLRSAGKEYFAGALNLVSAPSAQLDNLEGQLPDLGGVSLGKWVGFLLAVPRYFSWRVEMWQGFLTPDHNGEMRVRAMLCRAGSVRNQWALARSASDKFDVRKTAFALAARLRGETFASSGATAADTQSRQVTFTSSESFGLFAEGLRALQEYGDQSDSPSPQRQKLQALLQEALDCLQECASEYPEDLLSRFYYGLALTIDNQQLYVERLYACRDSFAAWGRLLDLRDKSGPIEPERFTQEESQLAAQARPAQDLGNETWDKLNQAADLFDDLANYPIPSLQQAAAYNLAIVYSRLGKTDDLEKAIKLLENLGAPDADVLARVSERLSTKRRRRGDELRALSLQAGFEKEIMSCRLAVRRAVPADNPTGADRSAARQAYETASHNLDTAFAGILSAHLDEGIRLDLAAEFLTKRGYLQYDLATSAGAPILLPGESSRTHLEKARNFLNDALVRKNHWNPAQVYLALVLQVMGETKEAESLFASLRGVETTERSPSVAPRQIA